MTVRVITHPEAQGDIRRAQSWYDDIAPALGDDFARRVLDTLERIAGNPRLYAAIGGGLRRAFVRRFPYHVIYRIHRDRVNVLAVCHSQTDRRNILAQASRREGYRAKAADDPQPRDSH